MSHTAAAVVQCATDRAGVQPRPRPMPALADFGLQPDDHTSALQWFPLNQCNYHAVQQLL